MKEIGLWRALCNHAPLSTFACIKERRPLATGTVWPEPRGRSYESTGAHDPRPQREETKETWARHRVKA